MEKHQERNLEAGNVFVFGDIVEERIERVLEEIFYLATKRRHRPKEITVWINSPGGLLQPALALADVFDRIKPSVRTVALGSVESAASYVLMAGTPGRRFVSRFSSIMLHEFSWSNCGSYTEMAGRQAEVERTRERQVQFVVERTGLSVSKVRRILRHEETWLAPEQAIEYGLVDGIFEG